MVTKPVRMSWNHNPLRTKTTQRQISAAPTSEVQRGRLLPRALSGELHARANQIFESSTRNASAEIQTCFLGMINAVNAPAKPPNKTVNGTHTPICATLNHVARASVVKSVGAIGATFS